MVYKELIVFSNGIEVIDSSISRLDSRWFVQMEASNLRSPVNKPASMMALPILFSFCAG